MTIRGEKSIYYLHQHQGTPLYISTRGHNCTTFPSKDIYGVYGVFIEFYIYNLKCLRIRIWYVLLKIVFFLDEASVFKSSQPLLNKTNWSLDKKNIFHSIQTQVFGGLPEGS